MTELFAITVRGLEGISSAEMEQVPELQVSQVSYRRISAFYTGELARLLRLRTVDDVFLTLADWNGIVPQRSALIRLARLAQTLELDSALEAVAQIRPLTASPTFSVTANFVGKRNYNTQEIKDALVAGILEQYGWLYAADANSEVNIRIFLEHERASVGMRLAAAPLHRRPYKQENLPGSLKPTVAAAMLFCAGVLPGMSVMDPCCGAGTILIEAALSGANACGGDNDLQALAAARNNATKAAANIIFGLFDARHLPLENGSVANVVTNLPWGRQVEVGQEIAAFYKQGCAEIDRILARNGQAVVLTNLPHLLDFKQHVKISHTEISLFGQKPAIVNFVGE